MGDPYLIPTAIHFSKAACINRRGGHPRLNHWRSTIALFCICSIRYNDCKSECQAEDPLNPAVFHFARSASNRLDTSMRVCSIEPRCEPVSPSWELRAPEIRSETFH